MDNRLEFTTLNWPIHWLGYISAFQLDQVISAFWTAHLHKWLFTVQFS